MMPNSIYIIAEAGVNHNGDLEIAKEMISIAQKAGADAIKFQTFIPENIVSKTACKAAYQQESVGKNETQLEMLKTLAFGFQDFRALKNECEKMQIQFLSTAFDIESVIFLESLDIALYKIPSGEITNLPYLIKIAQMGKPIIMSTGMCDLDEVETALAVLERYNAGPITLLHCNTEYPTPFEDVNLKAMLAMKEKFNKPIGYSDHTSGIEVAIAAAALGARVIEKHFTLDRDMAGPDHKASLMPDQFADMVTSIRNVEKATAGNGVKKVSKSEMKNKDIVRKSIVAKVAIKKGEKFTEKNIAVKRPGNGVSPMKWFDILGQIAVRDFQEDELIE